MSRCFVNATLAAFEIPKETGIWERLIREQGGNLPNALGPAIAFQMMQKGILQLEAIRQLTLIEIDLL
jgi:hypothetical protein